MALALVNKRTDHAHLLHRLARVFRLLEDRVKEEKKNFFLKKIYMYV